MGKPAYENSDGKKQCTDHDSTLSPDEISCKTRTNERHPEHRAKHRPYHAKLSVCNA